MDEKPKVCIYIRVSTDKQEMEQQIVSCKKFCDYKDLEYTDDSIYTDIGSGKDYFNRPGYANLLKDLRSMKYRGVVAFRFDRLGRNASEACKFFEEMENKGIDIYSLNENMDTTTAIGRAIRDIIVRLAQLERENISEATKQRLQALKNMGRKLGRPVGHGDKKKRKKSGYYGNKNRSKVKK